MDEKKLEMADRYRAEDEIDLFELFSSLAKQWKWLVGITLSGLFISLMIALLSPKQYEVSAQVALPSKADVAEIGSRGYEASTPQALFSKFHQELRSPEALRSFVKSGRWEEKLFPEVADQDKRDSLLSEFIAGFSIEVLASQKENGANNDSSQNLVGLKFLTADEPVGVALLNSYVENTNQQLINEIKIAGKKRQALERESLQKKISLFRQSMAEKRGLSILKLEEENQLKIEKLKQSIDLLLKKQLKDEQTKLAKLNEALRIAQGMKIKKPTTISAFSESRGEVLTTQVNVTTGTRSSLFLMGSYYLKAEMNNISLRKHKALFIPEISALEKEMETAKHDKNLAALKARKSDDPYITELPSVLKKLNGLEKLTFDFSSTSLYSWDKKATIDGKAEKPKRALIMAVGGILSLFVALIVGAVKRRKVVVEA